METPLSRKDALKLGAAAGVAFSATGLLPRAAKAAPVGAGSKPSILLILVDDMPDRLLEVMETVQNRIIAQGTRFLNAYTAIPLCGPNRAAILSGRFPHTTNVTTNSAWQAFSAGGHEAFTFVKALNDAGYDTALFGKYMNGRGGSTSIPPGWDRWFELPGSSTHSSTSYVVNDQGKNVSYPNTKNDSELAYEKALAWINSRTPATIPFFIQYSPTNPHNPYTPTAAHAHDYDNEPPRNVPSVNEADMSDKPAIMRNKAPVSVAELERIEEGVREELEDTDDFVAGLIDAAEAVTGNSNLLVIFTSDNGVQSGEHRLVQKSWPYQEFIEVPLIVRGTGLPAQQPTQLVSSVDISWTILNFAGAAPPRPFDGRSLHEIVLGIQPVDAPWRKRVLIEDKDDRSWEMYREYQPAAGKDFAFIRRLNDPTPEFYDLTVDEYQLDSKPAMITADMRSKLDRLTSLTGANLRAVEEEASTTQGGDTTAPETTITSGPSSTISTTTATFAFFSNEPNSRFECKLDPVESAFSSCVSPKSYSSLANSSYTFSVRAIDAAGNTDTSPATRSFTVSTTQHGDTTAPTVMSTLPTANATGVSTTTNVTATFSEAMLASSINGTNFKLFKKGSTTKLSATVSYDASTNTATLDPTNSLRSGVSYKAVVTTGAKDLAGKPLTQQYKWFFTVR
jgi:N-acetylglucosamine-6-sulfatase